MTTIESGALEAILAHHRTLVEDVARRVTALQKSVEGGGRWEPSSAELVAYLAGEVLPHALAEEKTIYRAAGDLSTLAGVVADMTREHRWLASSIEQLATAADGSQAADEAGAIGTTFAGHVSKENEMLLPALAADPTVDLPALLQQMHEQIEAAQRAGAPDEGHGESDSESALLKLLVEAATLLAAGGEGDQACRLVAGAWAVLRAPRPDLATRVTAVLHRLVRSVTAEPVSFSARPAGGKAAPGAVLDVRPLAPAQRHEKIFATYGALAPGAAFVLVNDHDPKPLRYQFEAEHAGGFTWDYLETGPAIWKVRIGRVGAGVAL